jgi:hypothetical protein
MDQQTHKDLSEQILMELREAVSLLSELRRTFSLEQTTEYLKVSAGAIGNISKLLDIYSSVTGFTPSLEGAIARLAQAGYQVVEEGDDDE